MPLPRSPNWAWGGVDRYHHKQLGRERPVTALGHVFGWLGRTGVVFVVLVLAILIYWSFKPWYAGYDELRRTADALVSGQRALALEATKAIDRSNGRTGNAWRFTKGQLDDRITAAEAERAPIAAACSSDVAALVTQGAAGVIDNRKQCVRAALLTREIDSLTAVRASIDARRPGEPPAEAVRRQADTMRRAIGINRDAQARVRVLQADYVPDLLQRTELQQQIDRAAQSANSYARAKQNAQLVITSQNGVAAAARNAAAILSKARDDYGALVKERTGVLSRSAVERARTWAKTNKLADAIRLAAITLVFIILSPFLIRLFCYYVLAPIAMRRPNIRLWVPGGAEAAIPPADRSATSVAVRLAEGEEVLVRQDYLQTTSLAATKSTQWFLDWRHPITSSVTGLTFLTRIRGAGEVTTVSAVRDPFAELTIVTLPDGAACVLHPRALAAVAQPTARPLRVATQWRLTSLNAWLTLQLRYIVFHGPARLVIKGGRGVRVERAEQGRIFGQDQLVGFSADLSYAVTRTETFWPYLLGRESLLKDRVAAGSGVLIVEEAPLTSRNGRARRGIEGLIDAGMKVFGM